MTVSDTNGAVPKTIALILAGKYKFDLITKRKHRKEIREAYDGEEIYLGENKFLYMLAGKPIIEYVLDSVYNAEENGRRIYDKIYVYNDVKSFYEKIDASRYDNLMVKQMTDSVAGHWKDFYRQIDYGQRVDVFFGDTPMVNFGGREYIHNEYSNDTGQGKGSPGSADSHDLRNC
jgi:bifunctional N-acetylglucosamine-1-phosphate-uridyltransferase/glucosamine-1-phosphate-acetyltransferase GlmU-like protein